MTEYEIIVRQTEFLRSLGAPVPEVVVVLGSGQGALDMELVPELTVDYRDIPDFPVSTVAGHAGRLLFGKVNGVNVAVMQGRVHYYEGYTPCEVVRPIRVLHLLGARSLLLTNASGGLAYSPGTLVAIRDHVTSFVPSPLIGPNIDELGVRFPDMSNVYDAAALDALRTAARHADVHLAEGVYVQLTGPQFETPAEIRMARVCGADIVGMSTAIEALAARHCGYAHIAAISCVTNYAAGLSPVPLTHEEVAAAAAGAAKRIRSVVIRFISEIAKI